MEQIEQVNKQASQPDMTPTMKPKDKKKKKLLEIDSEYEDLLSEQLDTFTSNSPSGKPEPPRQVEI